MPLRRFLLCDLAVDLVGMSLHVRPGVRKILRRQRRVVVKQVGVGYPKTPVLFQSPDGNSGVANARIATLDARCTSNALGDLTSLAHRGSRLLTIYRPNRILSVSASKLAPRVVRTGLRSGQVD